MKCDACTITGFVIAALLFILVLSVEISGILGYLDTKESECIVTSCNDTKLFNNGNDQTIAHVFIQLNQDTSKGLSQQNSDYYDVKNVCEQIPEVVKCYSYHVCGKWSCKDYIYPVRQLNPIWALFSLCLFAPICILTFTCIHCCKPYCGSSCCNSCCGYWKPYGKWTTVGTIVLGLFGIIVLMIVGILGFLDNSTTQCLKTGCTLEESIDNSRVVKDTKVTIALTQFDSQWHLQQLQYTYLDHSKHDCSQVDNIIPCYVRDNNISTERIQNSIFGMLAIPLIFGIVATCLVSCLS